MINPQVISIPLFSRSSQKIEDLLNHFGSRKIKNGNKIYNLYYAGTNLTSDEKLFQIVSIFKHAIVILDDIDLKRPQYEISLNEKLKEISNYKLLKTLQYYGYEQILILTSENSEFFKWIEQEVLQVFNDQNDSSISQEELQNPLKLMIPKIQIASTQIMPNELQFSIEESLQLHEQDLWLSIMESLNNKGQSSLVYVISGFVMTNQTIHYQQQGQLQKTVVVQMKDYLTKESINFARQGDLIEVEFKNKGISGLALGLQAKKYRFDKVITANIVFYKQDRNGYEKRFKKAPIKLYYFGQQVTITQRTFKGVLGENGEVKAIFSNKMEQFPYSITFQIQSQYFPMQFIKFQFCCSNEKTKGTLEREICFYGCIECKNPDNLMVRQNEIIIVDYVTVIQNPIQIAKEEMIKDGVDIRKRCRICLQNSPQYVPKECGHLRYCIDCKDVILEAKQCFYCEANVTEMINLNIIRVDINISQLQLLTKQQIIEYFSQDPSKELTDYLKLDLEENVNVGQIKSFFCRFCSKQVCQYYQICENKHCYKSCTKCNPKACLECHKPLSQKTKIITEFPDDPQ